MVTLWCHVTTSHHHEVSCFVASVLAPSGTSYKLSTRVNCASSWSMLTVSRRSVEFVLEPS